MFIFRAIGPLRSLPKAASAHSAFSQLQGRGRGTGTKIPGLWTSLGPSKAVNPAFLNRHGSEYVTSGRITPSTLYVTTTRAVRGVSSVTGGSVSIVPGAAQWGLYKSTDGGASFTFIHNGAPSPGVCTGDTTEATGAGPCSPRGVRSFAIDPVDHNTLYAGSYSRGVWRSNDAGATWTQIKTPVASGSDTTSRPMFAVTTLPSGDTRMYVGDGTAGNPAAGVWRSDSVRTGTPTFTSLSSNNPADRGYATFNYCTGQCWYDNFVISPPGHPDIVYVGGSYQYNEDHLISNARGVVLSQDAGATWSDLTEDATSPTAPNGLHPDQHILVANPANPLQVWEGSDGGLMRTSGSLTDTSSRCDSRDLSGDALQQCKWLLAAVPTTWTSLNNGLNTLQFQSLTVNPADPKDVQGGTQDNGTFETTGHVWRTTTAGLGSMSQAEFQTHCNEFTGDFSVVCGDWQPLGGNAAATQLINAAFGDRAGGTVAATERASSDKSTLWAATSTGRVFVSRNADAANAADVSFTRIDTLSTVDPQRFVSGIAVDPANANHAWISYSGFDETTPTTPGHVFSVTYNPTAGSATWTSIDGHPGLLGPGNLPTTDIAFDQKTGDLYVSTDFGVLRKPGLLPVAVWFTAGIGLPQVEVPGLTIDVAHRQLITATHGRGAYRLTLF